MNPLFQFSIRKMALKRLNVFVHHHEDINVKVKMLVDDIWKGAISKNNILWRCLNSQTNALIAERTQNEELRKLLQKQDIKLCKKKEELDELIEEQEKQNQLNQWLREQAEDPSQLV